MNIILLILLITIKMMIMIMIINNMNELFNMNVHELYLIN